MYMCMYIELCMKINVCIDWSLLVYFMIDRWICLVCVCLKMFQHKSYWSNLFIKNISIQAYSEFFYEIVHNPQWYKWGFVNNFICVSYHLPSNRRYGYTFP